MLRYLMKYDLKKMLNLLKWFYAIAIVLAGITRLLDIWSNIQVVSIIKAVFAGCTYSAIANIIINTFIHILMRFTTSFYKDQSYLTHTLPVKKDTLILSKFLSALIVVIFSVFVSVLSLFIVLYSPEFMQMLKMALHSAVAGYTVSGGTIVALLVAIILTQICTYISMGFTALVKGYSYNHHRGVRGFLYFILCYFVVMIATLVVITIVSAIGGNISNLFAERMSQGAFLTVLIVGLVMYALSAVGFYFLCKHEFNKGVNVD